MTISTDELDGTNPEDRHSLVAICDMCYEPHHFTGKRERFIQTHGEICRCGHKSFSNTQSQRTFDPKKKRKILKNKR